MLVLEIRFLIVCNQFSDVEPRWDNWDAFSDYGLILMEVFCVADMCMRGSRLEM